MLTTLRLKSERRFEPRSELHSIHTPRALLAELRDQAMALRTLGYEIGAVAHMLDINEEDVRVLAKPSKTQPRRLPRRVLNVLLRGRHAKIGGRTIAERARHLAQIAAAYSAEELLAEPGIGHVMLMEIEFWLEERGLSLAEERNKDEADAADLPLGRGREGAETD